MSRTRRLLATILLISGCQPPAPVLGPQVPLLTGRIADRFQIQATYADLVPGGTVSLIEPGSERTVAGGTTSADGSFAVAFEPDFQPAAGTGYWLDVSRRLANTWFSLRTVAVWDGNRWLTISNGPEAPDESVLVNAKTTAIALLLRDSGLPLSAALGRLSGGTLGAGRTPEMAQALEAQVRAAMAAERDPLEIGAGAVLSIEPPAVAPGERVTIRGFGFGPGGSVTVAGNLLSTTSWQPGQIEAVLPSVGQGGELVVSPTGGEPIRLSVPLRLRGGWRTLPPLPTPVGGDTAAVGFVAGQLLVAGGKDANGKAIGNVWAFDAAAGKWRSRAPLPTPRYGMASAVVADKLVAIGGWNDAVGYADAVEAYDAKSDRWQRLASLPAKRLGAAGASLNDTLYVFGGYDGQEANTSYVYNAASDSWATAAPMPAASYRLGATAWQGRILLAGGRSGGKLTAQAALYDAAADVWIPTVSLPAPRSAGCLVGDGQRAWFFAGNDGKPRAEAWQFTGSAWKPMRAAPTARAGVSGAWGRGDAVVVGGTSGDGAAGIRVEAFSP